MLCCNICNCKLKPFININKLLNYNYCSNCFHILSTSYTPNTPCQNEINEQLKNIINQLKSQRCIVNLLYIYVKNKPNINFEIPSNIHIDYREVYEVSQINCDRKYDFICCLYMNNIFDPNELIKNCLKFGSIYTIYYFTTKYLNSIFNYQYYNLSENDKCIYSSNSMQILARKYGLFINNVNKITINQCDYIICRLSIFELVDSNLLDYLLQEIEFNLYDENIYDKYQSYFIFYKNTLENTLIKYKLSDYNIIVDILNSDYPSLGLENNLGNFETNLLVKYLPHPNVIKTIKICELSDYLSLEIYNNKFKSNNYLIITLEPQGIIYSQDFGNNLRNNNLVLFILNPLRLEIVSDFMNLV